MKAGRGLRGDELRAISIRGLAPLYSVAEDLDEVKLCSGPLFSSNGGTDIELIIHVTVVMTTETLELTWDALFVAASFSGCTLCGGVPSKMCPLRQHSSQVHERSVSWEMSLTELPHQGHTFSGGSLFR